MSNSMDNWPLEAVNRLLLKLITHKPVGINKHFNMVLLTIFLNNIFDFEDDINFEDYLSENDFETLKKRRQEGKIDPKKPMAFSPSYSIRPTIEQVEAKLNEFYDLELIQENELIPEELERKTLFDLSKFFTLPYNFQTPL
ncbi:hypothetical protein ACQ4LE_000457 [Meloidogyne hapla]